MRWSQIIDLANRPLFSLGETPVSIVTLAQIALVFLLVAWAARKSRGLVRDRILARVRLDESAREPVARIASYLITLLGWLIGLSMVGIDLTSLTVLLGALGVGLGFGLQNIVGNFVSGLIILVERPIQVGHRVEVAGTVGRVVRIGARSTTVVTNDNIAMVIPNSSFIEQQVLNWSLGGDRRVRFRLRVGVSYGSDPRTVERLLLEVARNGAAVLADPSPAVVFLGFGESSLDFELRVWTDTMSERPRAFLSPLFFAIWETFKQNGVEIPFPQRDVHVKGPVVVATPARSA